MCVYLTNASLLMKLLFLWYNNLQGLVLRLLSDVYTIACVCLFAENIKIIRFINFVAFGHVYCWEMLD